MIDVVCGTIGELRKAIKDWPDEKPLIMDIDGNTAPVRIYEWTGDERDQNDCSWPAAIDGNPD